MLENVPLAIEVAKEASAKLYSQCGANVRGYLYRFKGGNFVWWEAEYRSNEPCAALHRFAV